MHPVLLKQKRLQVASEGGTVEIRVSQFIRQCIPSCRRSHGEGTTAIRVQLEPWGFVDRGPDCTSDWEAVPAGRELHLTVAALLFIPKVAICRCPGIMAITYETDAMPPDMTQLFSLTW